MVRWSLLVCVLVSASGCTAIFAKGPPDVRDLRPGAPIDCTDHYGFAVADAILGTVAALSGVIGIGAGSELNKGEPFIAAGAVGVAGGIAHFISAGTGSVAACRRLKHLQRAGRLQSVLAQEHQRAAEPFSDWTAPAGTRSKPAVEARSATPLALEEGRDRPGADYRVFGAVDPAACRDACVKEARCRAFTFVSAGLRGPQSRCFLKEAMPRPREAPGFVSGTR